MPPATYSLDQVAAAFAKAAVVGVWKRTAVLDQWRKLIEPLPNGLKSVAMQLIGQFAHVPSQQVVAEFLQSNRMFQQAYAKNLVMRRVGWCDHQIVDAALAPKSRHVRNWDLPELTSPTDLASLLDCPENLLWQLADHRRCYWLRQSHYRLRMSRKRSGGLRLIEAPKPKLKTVQRRIWKRIIRWIPAHQAAHGFQPRRSIRSNAALHTGQSVVIRMDLQNFFASVSGARIAAIFRTAGYPESVALLLARLCTSKVSRFVWQMLCDENQAADLHGLVDQVSVWHLPQGAPTSPALANLAAFRLDRRLTGLAASMSSRYSRYADDLIFSGPTDLAKRSQAFVAKVTEIMVEEGFLPNTRKTRIMRPSVRQSVCGLTVNQKVNSNRADFKQLQAILHNCVTLGPAGQNRANVADFRAHLAGRIQFQRFIHPQRAAKLEAMFVRIKWP
ncbi:MAG: RNA-directed DNA polymerase [Planctomycetales bacterium]|nr:RNA-directed DNA polymerase [Planctomycetales bacterium]